MQPQYFIGIVPPNEYFKRIEQFQKQWMKKLGVEPHITLKVQGGLTPDKEWIQKVENVCDTFTPFSVTLSQPNYFGDSILFLSVRSDDLFTLHREIVRAVAPSEKLIAQYFELDAYVPHLTLGKESSGEGISSGLTKLELKEMERLAEKELTPYPTFRVEFVRIYELDVANQRYEKYMDISLGS